MQLRKHASETVQHIFAENHNEVFGNRNIFQNIAYNLPARYERFLSKSWRIMRPRSWGFFLQTGNQQESKGEPKTNTSDRYSNIK